MAGLPNPFVCMVAADRGRSIQGLLRPQRRVVVVVRWLQRVFSCVDRFNGTLIDGIINMKICGGSLE